MSGWLSSVPTSIPSIPSFRKADGTAEGTEGVDPALGVESPASEKSVKGSPTEKDEDDNSR